MKFSKEGKEVELRGIAGKPGKIISSNSMTKLLKKEQRGVIAQLCSPDVSTSKLSISLDLQKVLDNHSKVFEAPKGLPSIRNHDHAIHPIPGSVPPNIRPYRYPYAQKSEIEYERPISFESRPVKGKFIHKAIYEKEMLAILHALKKWKPCLIGRHFKVKTDHDSLKYFLEQILSYEEKQKWVTKMLGYDFEIIYKKGKQNVVSNALSKKDDDVEALLCSISIIQPNWINEAREEWKNDEEMWALIQKLQQDSNTSDTFSW
eukprot:PITA_17484